MFVLFFFTTLSTYKQCYQKIDVLHHLRFTVKHNTASAPPTFPWYAPSHPWFPTSTRAYFFVVFCFFTRPARRLKGTVTELFPLPAAHAAARTVCGRMRTTCTTGRTLPCRRQGGVATGLHDQQKEKGTNLLHVWGVMQRCERGRGQRKTDPWPLQNHLTFTVSIFSLRLDGQPRRLTELPGSMFTLLNWRISFPLYFSEDGRSW